MNNAIRDYAEPVVRPSTTPELTTRYDRVFAAGCWLVRLFLIVLAAYLVVWAVGSMMENAARADAAVRQASGPVCPIGSGVAYSCVEQ